MKANELMIGDLVYLIHTEDNIAPYKEEIRIEADDLSRDACILEAHYEPIPLTPEILEKNGFKDIDKEDNCDGYDIYWTTGDGFSINTQDLHLHYVHELQHALRLCGIEKEIEI